ncbi:CD226 antigen isoform X3 [Cavia porcellus]|uniref:CD226 antigen isoform X3 n=1 Tax=Cavia porcellus TaxID=10141 RepID=UPI002FDFEC47
MLNSTGPLKKKKTTDSIKEEGNDALCQAYAYVTLYKLFIFNRTASKSFSQMDHFAFLLAILQVYKALCEETLWDTMVSLAENMTLECVYPFMDNLTQAEWIKIVGKQEQSMAVFHPTLGVVIQKPYENKVHFLNSAMALHDMTLSFNNASEADVGTYYCLFLTFPQGSWQKTIQVVQSDSFETQLRDYSNVVSSPGHVTLTYVFQMNGTVQQVTWERIQPHQIDLLMRCNLSRGTSWSRYRKQIVTNCTQGLRSTFIIIPNATASDSGFYRCNVTFSTGQNETFLRRLTITDEKASNQDAIAVAGGTVSFLFVILIVTITVIFYMRRRRRQKNVPVKNSSDTQNKTGTKERTVFYKSRSKPQ